MKHPKPTDFAYHLSKFFKSYMPGTLGLRPKSIESYQTAIYVFMRFMKNEKGVLPDKMTLDTLNLGLLIEYLDYLEATGNKISTRNHRLTVLRSFFSYVQLVEPKQILLMQQLLSLKHKKQPKPIVNYLSADAVKMVMAEPRATTKEGYRDMLLLTLLYETAARVSELTGIKVGEIRLDTPATAILHGKKGKSRIVPLSKDTAALIRNYLEKEKMSGFHHGTKLLFTNRSGIGLTGAGVTYILKKYATGVRDKDPRLIPTAISPHCMRHSKAMHLLQAGVSLIYIRDFLGHDHIKSTEIYARTDDMQKRMAIEGAYIDLPDDSGFSGDWNEDLSLMRWIAGICG